MQCCGFHLKSASYKLLTISVIKIALLNYTTKLLINFGGLMSQHLKCLEILQYLVGHYELSFQDFNYSYGVGHYKVLGLTHWALGNVAVILEVKFSNSLYGMIYWTFALKLAWRWIPQNLINKESTLIQVMTWCHQTTSHYLSHCWLWSMSSYGVTSAHWVN